MARIDNFHNFTPQDYRDAPEWFRRFLDHLNPSLEQLTSALQAGITTANKNEEIISIDLKDGVEQEIQAPRIKGAIEEIRVIWAEEKWESIVWDRSALGAKVTVEFVGSPSGFVGTRIKVVGG